MYTLSDYDRGFLDEITPTFTDAQVFGLGVEYGLENMTPVALKTVYDSWTDSSPILSREKYNEVYKDLGIKYEGHDRVGSRHGAKSAGGTTAIQHHD